MLGDVDTVEDRLRGRVVDDAPSTILQNKMIRKAKSLHRPVHHDVLELGPGGRRCKAEGGRVVDNVEHVSEDIRHVDGGRIVAEEFRRLPSHSAREDDFLGHFHDVVDGVSFLRGVFLELMPQKSRFNFGENDLIVVRIDLVSAILDQIKHLLTSIHQGLG